MRDSLKAELSSASFLEILGLIENGSWVSQGCKGGLPILSFFHKLCSLCHNRTDWLKASRASVTRAAGQYTKRGMAQKT